MGGLNHLTMVRKRTLNFMECTVDEVVWRRRYEYRPLGAVTIFDSKFNRTVDHLQNEVVLFSVYGQQHTAQIPRFYFHFDINRLADVERIIYEDKNYFCKILQGGPRISL